MGEMERVVVRRSARETTAELLGACGSSAAALWAKEERESETEGANGSGKCWRG